MRSFRFIDQNHRQALNHSYAFTGMDIVLIILGIILSLAGLAGCIVPGLPGPPLNFIGLLLIHWACPAFTATFLVTWGILTVLVVVLDYMLPVWTAKKFGATRQGIVGSVAGMLIGLFFTPIGMIAGLIVGAMVGDMMAGRSHSEAARSGIATFFGTLFSIGLKLVISGILFFYAVKAVVQQLC